jgi:hypothetical protein
MSALLQGAVEALERMLRNKDWKARDSAISHILRIHGKYIDRVDLTGQLDHTGSVRHVHAELVEGSMSDEMRAKAMELLKLQRGMLQRQLPEKFANTEHHDHHDPLNGQFSPSE